MTPLANFGVFKTGSEVGGSELSVVLGLFI